MEANNLITATDIFYRLKVQINVVITIDLGLDLKTDVT